MQVQACPVYQWLKGRANTLGENLTAGAEDPGLSGELGYTGVPEG